MEHCVKMQLSRYHYHHNNHQQLGLNRPHMRASHGAPFNWPVSLKLFWYRAIRH
jgi:hypothetical protein